MREPSTAEQAVLNAMRDGVIDGVGVKTLTPPGEKVDTWAKTFAGEKAMHRSLAAFGASYQEFRSHDPDAALRWASGVLTAMGFDREVLCRAIEVRGTAEVDREVQEGVAASAQTLAARLRGAPVEEVAALAQAAVRENLEALLAVRAHMPQGMTFAFGSAR